MKEYQVEGRPPSPEGQFWRQALQEMRKDSVKTVEEGAKQLIALVTLLAGLYFHAGTFSRLPPGSIGLPWLAVDLWVLFVGPLAAYGRPGAAGPQPGLAGRGGLGLP